jgi:hypothetical protein
MDNIHAPTVRSDPTAVLRPNNNPDVSTLTPLELFDKRDRLEEELKALGGVLYSVSAQECSTRYRLTGSYAAWR